MKNYLDIAIKLAQEAGAIQMEGLGKKHNVEFKGIINIVTEIDKKCEDLIVGRIHKDYPSHDVLAEEGTGRRKSSDYRWIIDPLDATVNYNHGYPMFGPAIALEYKGDIILGVVYIPTADELFVAEKGGGACLNNRKIHVSGEDVLQNSLLITGFAYNVQEGEQKNNLKHFENFMMKSRAVRRDGMAEGDFCYVACGRAEGFWELYLKPWDVAAGVIMVKEAGGRVTGFNGREVDIYGMEVVATNSLIHDQMQKVLNEKTAG